MLSEHAIGPTNPQPNGGTSAAEECSLRNRHNFLVTRNISGIAWIKPITCRKFLREVNLPYIVKDCSMKKFAAFLLMLSLGLFTIGCGSPTEPTADSDADSVDSTDSPEVVTPPEDSSVPAPDADAPKTDADAPKTDADAPKTDADAPKTDADAPKTDADAPSVPKIDPPG
jgi:hypothetical protein